MIGMGVDIMVRAERVLSALARLDSPQPTPLEQVHAMAMPKYPPLDIVRQSLRYEGGRLFWLHRPVEHFPDVRAWKSWNTQFAFKEAGSLKTFKRSGPRWVIVIGNVHIQRPTIVWALHQGEWHKDLDHRNRDALDDRIDNLRVATRSQQGANRGIQSNNTSGCPGVMWYAPTKRWRVKIKVMGRDIYLGYYVEKSKAIEVYWTAAREFFGEFAANGA